MNYEKGHIRIALRWLAAVVIALTLCAVISMLTGCKTRYVTQEVPVTIHDSIHVVQTERITDTIRETNTISLIDTMWLDTSTVATLGMPILHHDRTTNVSSNKEEKSNKESVDTIYIEKEKPVPYKVKVPVEKPLKWWQKSLMWLGGILAVLLASCIGFVFWRIKH